LPWKRATLGRAARPLWAAFALSLSLAALAFAVQTGRGALGPVGLFLGAWLISGAAVDLFNRTGRGRFGSRLARMTRLPGADWGKAIAHSGLGVTMIGIAGLMAWQAEDIRVVQVKGSYDIAGYTLTLDKVERVQGPNYISTMGHVTVTKDGAQVAVLTPEKRVYPVAGMPTTEAAIDYGFLRDVYVVIGDPQDNGGWAMRTYYKPLANWIWAGSILMALGGMFSLFDRRYRVAAGARRRAPAAGVPAE